LRRLVPVLTLSFAVLVACSGSGESTKAFCSEVKELRKLGRDPASTEPAEPALLRSTIAGLRDLERSAPSDVKSDVAMIRETLETIADLGEGKAVDPQRIERLSTEAEKVRAAGKSIDRQVAECGIKVGSTSPPTIALRAASSAGRATDF
jgi:hypothetical protein